MQTQIKKLVLKKFYLRLRSQGNIRFLENFMSYLSIVSNFIYFHLCWINFNFVRISPPPIRGKFIPISKWGPHDRYAPTKKESNRFSQATTQKSTRITTPPYVTKPMKNTVIPFWFSNKKTTNNQGNNSNKINIEMMESSTDSMEDLVKTAEAKKYDKDNLFTTEMPSYNFEGKKN